MKGISQNNIKDNTKGHKVIIEFDYLFYYLTDIYSWGFTPTPGYFFASDEFVF